MLCTGCNAGICQHIPFDNKGEDAMPNKVKWKSVDQSTFYVYDGEAYQPPLVTYGDKPLDRDDDGRWGGEVRE
jgi:hypothetical protein